MVLNETQGRIISRFVSLALLFGLLSAAAGASTIVRKTSFAAAPGSPFHSGVGDAPISVAAGDFNRDGFLDLAIANSSDNSVTVLLGHGDGTFTPHATLDTGGNLTTAVAVGDFNNDGKLDVVVAEIPGGLSGIFNGITGSLGGTISVFLGDGTGSFGDRKDSDVGADLPDALAVGDFNGDGKLDAAVANLNNQNVSVLLGHGDGNFDLASGSPIHTGHRPTSVAVADFNLDGKLDIAVTNAEDNNVLILLNNGNGTFVSAPSGPIATGARPVSVVAADFNGDGRPDLAVANLLSSTVSIFLGNGTGAFQLVKELHTGRYPSAISARDFDNDGKPDVAVVNQLSEIVSVFLGDGAGSFGPPRNFSLDGHPQSIAAGDFNKDGQLDVAVGNVATKSVSVILNNTDITPPVLTMPVLNPSYLLNSIVTFNFGATDAQSGVASIVATLNGVQIVSGTTVTLNHLGTNTFTLTATDNNANTATQTATFAVVYNFGGFLPPIPGNSTGVFTRGGTLPVSFQLSDTNGTIVPTAVATLTVQKVSGNVPVGNPIDATSSGNSDDGNLFRSDNQKYTYNLSTKPLSTGTYQLQVHLDDGTVHTVLIGVK